MVAHMQQNPTFTYSANDISLFNKVILAFNGKLF